MYSENVYFPSINNTIWIIHWNNTNRISHCVFLCITSFIYGNLWPAIILWHCLSVFYRNKGQLDLTFVLKYLSHSLFIFRGNFFGIFPIKKMTKRKSNRKKKTRRRTEKNSRVFALCDSCDHVHSFVHMPINKSAQITSNILILYLCYIWHTLADLTIFRNLPSNHTTFYHFDAPNARCSNTQTLTLMVKITFSIAIQMTVTVSVCS